MHFIPLDSVFLMLLCIWCSCFGISFVSDTGIERKIKVLKCHRAAQFCRALLAATTKSQKTSFQWLTCCFSSFLLSVLNEVHFSYLKTSSYGAQNPFGWPSPFAHFVLNRTCLQDGSVGFVCYKQNTR